MLITVTQTNWPDRSRIPQRTRYWAFGQPLASTTEFGLEWLHSRGFESIVFGVRQILAGVLGLPVISSLVWAKLCNLNLSFLICKMR